jgi:hypothetical protein
MLKKIPTIILLFFCLINIASADDVLGMFSKWKENYFLSRLASVQENLDNEIAEFKTDGCSGGLSNSWAWMADTFPDFELNHNSEPPWQHCCVDHDQLYWKGETKDGFKLRKQADSALQQCVIETGKVKVMELAKNSETKKFLIEAGFKKVALQMYVAVRLGGGPCTLFPWRWGYG